jgi:hypothetical protein
MLFLLASLVGAGSLATLGILIAKAPEGYETDTGFQVVERRSTRKSVRQSGWAVAQARP